MSGLQDTDLADDLPPPPAGPGLFGDEPAAPPPVAAKAAPAPTPYRVLARKYRPTTFADLIGQEAMVRILRNAFAQNRIAHAWMLTGVRGVGKTTTARIIARALNCIGPDGQGGPTADPCGVCANCVAILADRHPDVVEMDAASRTGVDDMREVIDAARYRPLQARTKVFIIDEVHMLSRNAFNALLKTLEEPPPHVKFIFATTEIRKVPVTVLSRCQRFDLRRVSVAEMTAMFGRIAVQEGVAADLGALDLIARAADGSVRDGLSLLDQAIAQGAGAAGPIGADAVSDMLGLADRSAVFDLLEAVMAGQPAAALAITDRAHERGADLGLMLGDLLDLTHTLTRLRTVPALRDGGELPEAERTRGAALADRLSMPLLGRAWQMLLKGTQEVEQAPDRRAAAEMVLIRLCYAADLPTPGDLVRRLTEGGAAPSAPRPAGAPPPFDGGTIRAAVGSGPAPTDGSAVRAVANGAPAFQPDPAPFAPPPPPDPQPPRLSSFRDVAMLVAERREPLLHGALLHQVHLVRFAPPVIELRPVPDAPRDLAPRLAALLLDATGTRWTIALSREAGDPTLHDQGEAADQARRGAAAEHPLVRAILEAFPGARISRVTDSRADAYGLVDDEASILGGGDGREFAPLDAEDAGMMEDNS
ncbi:MAG TPA: DNA polymerase III subunit gamma/tau [Acetobacteraceae bacterium]